MQHQVGSRERAELLPHGRLGKGCERKRAKRGRLGRDACKTRREKRREKKRRGSFLQDEGKEEEEGKKGDKKEKEEEKEKKGAARSSFFFFSFSRSWCHSS